MSNEADRRITQQQAERIWRRAAELQAAAAERQEKRVRLAAAGAEPVDTEGVQVSDVRAAAIEAGIGEEYLQLALAETEADAAIRPGHGGRMDRLAERFLGDPPDAVEVGRTIAATPEAVYEAMQRLFPNPPFGLSLIDTRGRDTFIDGVLVFAHDASLAPGSGFTSELNLGDVKQIFITLRAGAEAGTCDIVLRAPLTRRRLNLMLGSVLTGATGSVSGLLGAGAGSILAAALGIFGGAAAAVVLAPAIGAGALGVSGGVFGYRRMYRWGMRQARNALESLAQALVVDARTRGAFTRRPLPGPSDDGEPSTS